jgi:hypothetical protein
MPRTDRRDEPGSWHHVFNRAIARRPMFERPTDVECFLGLAADATADGCIEVHAYTLLGTHFHVLARSPVGELSRALWQIQLGYVRWFNRSRKRDGPLMRNRFRSKVVDSLAYRRLLVRYIDANAPLARLAPDAVSYPFGSARHYVGAAGPSWLCRAWIESVVREELGLASYCPERYAEVFGKGFERAHADLVERTIRSRGTAPVPVDVLLGGADAAVQSWMRRKCALADGTAPGVPVVSAEHVDRAIDAASRHCGPWLCGKGRRRADGWRVLRAMLLRQLAGLRHAEIGQRMGSSRETARCLHQLGARALAANPEFARRAGEVCRQALDRCYGKGRGASSCR